MIAIYTYDLFPGREHLMPWRTVLEVAKVLTVKGSDVIVLNACHEETPNYQWQGVEIVSINIGYDKLAEVVKQENIHTIFIPFTWRDGLKELSEFGRINCQKIAYLPGGVYDVHSSGVLYRYSPASIVKPYFLESIVPYRFLAKKLNKYGISHTIGLTKLTADAAKKAKMPEPHCIYPGNDNFNEILSDYSVVEKYGLRDKKWLLFSGAPAPTRGAQILLEAIDRTEDDSLRVVMLMRTDVGSQYDAFEKAYNLMKYPERVIMIREKVTRTQLRAFFDSAWYALLPFIVIPSEVPLMYFELLSCGTPVITFQNGGTTEYLSSAILTANKSVKSLSKQLSIAWKDTELRKRKSKAGIELMKNHPTWTEVAAQWALLIENHIR